MRRLLISFLLLTTFGVAAAEKADHVVVIKSKKTLDIYKNDKILATYPVVFGANPIGPKEREGDERTPEGRYTLDFKKSDSAFYKSIHISYPNPHDTENARKRGFPPGGSIMIHGQKNHIGWLSFISQRFNWTDGCIALTNNDMDLVWDSINPGTPIEIKP